MQIAMLRNLSERLCVTRQARCQNTVGRDPLGETWDRRVGGVARSTRPTLGSGGRKCEFAVGWDDWARRTD